MDREKVIKGLACCQYSSKSHCDGCPYVYEDLCSTNDCTADLAIGALALLGEQEDEIAKFCGEVARLTALLEEHEEREKRICKGICDFIHGCCCTDTNADKDYVCDVIQQCFIHGGR